MKTRSKRILGWSVIIVLCGALLILASVLLSFLFYNGAVELSEPELGLYISIAGIFSLLYVGLRYFSEMSVKGLIINAYYYAFRFGAVYFILNVTLKTTRMMVWKPDYTYAYLWVENAKRDITSFRGIALVIIAVVSMLTVLWVIYHFVPAADRLFDKTYDLAVRISESRKEKRVRCCRERRDPN